VLRIGGVLLKNLYQKHALQLSRGKEFVIVFGLGMPSGGKL